ncbi:putative ribonuclease H-like domain-containing protein, partial [Tanacetum coccineum]
MGTYPETTQPENSTSIKMTVPANTEEKICKKNDVKARSLLLMSLPNEHQLTFNQYVDAQSMFNAIKAQFGGNEATKKTQKALLKQQYENFNASTSESLDSIFNRLQKLVSRLAILGVVTSQEDLNIKFLRSLPSEWDTHKVKKSTGAINGDKNLAFVTTSGTSSTNNFNSEVSTGTTKVNTASTETCTASFSDAIVYAFLSTQPQGSQLVHEDLEQIHDDDLEEIDLKWNMALLSMRARKFYQRTGRKIIIDGNNTVGFDKSKVECFNCHKMGHFSRECRAPRLKDNRNWNQGNSIKTVRIEDTPEKAMCAIDGVGFDWSDMAEEQNQTNMALMAFSDSEVHSDKSCSKNCLKNYADLKKQYDNLLDKFNDTAFKASTYKRGLVTLEEQIIKYKEHEVRQLRIEIEKVKQEKEGIDFKIAKFDKSATDLDEMLESQRSDKSKQGLGYTVVPPPHPLILNRPTNLDLSSSGLAEFKEPEVNMYGPRENVSQSANNCDKESDNSKENTDDSLEQHQVIKHQVSDSESSSTKSSSKVDKESVKDWKEKFFHPAGKVESDNQSIVKHLLRGLLDMQRCIDLRDQESGLKSLNTARPVNAVRSVNTSRPISTARSKAVNTARPLVNTVRANGFNAVKPSACWVGNPQLNDKGFVDSGCSRHMTGNLAYLSNFKEFNGGNVTFGGGAYGGRITGKGTLKTNNLDFEDLLDENQILLRIPREDNMYSFNMHNIVPKENLTCLAAKATSDESMLWHRRLGHINFKNINKLVKENLVRDLPSKRFENDQTCVACLKGKQHRASCKTKIFSPITKPLFKLHMDLFGPTFVSSLMHKKYCLVVTDDYSRFSWVFFLATKDETSEILKNFIKEIENLVDQKREYNVARTPQQNGVAERKNRTLIEAARTMLADSKLPTTFWAEAVSTACYVQNRVLVVKPHNKTPYELFRGFKPTIGFMKPFGCHVSILNTLDHLGKFNGKSDDGFFVGYSLSNKAFRVYNTRTKKVQENLHVGFLENKPMIEGNGPKWLFDIDSLTQSMNYVPVDAGTISNDYAGTQGVSDSSISSQQDQANQEYIVMPIWIDASYFDLHSQNTRDAEPRHAEHDENDDTKKSNDDSSLQDDGTAAQQVNTASPDVNTGSNEVSTVFPEVNTATPEVLIGPSLSSEDIQVESFNYLNDQEVDLGNIPNSYAVPSTPNTRVHKDHPIEHVIGDVQSSVQTRRMSTSYSEQGFLSAVYEGNTHQDLHTCHRAIGLKWVYRNKKDERGIVIRNKARLVAQGHTQEEGIDYDEVFAHIEEEVYVCQPPRFEDPDHPDKVYKVVKALYGLHQAPTAWYETLANYLLSNGFQRGKIDQTLFIKRQQGHILLVQIYVDDIIFGSTKKELCDEFEKLMTDNQDKYVKEILSKFKYTDVKTASTLVDLEKPLVQDGDVTDVDEHLYRSMIGSLMYLTASRPDIMFA